MTSREANGVQSMSFVITKFPSCTFPVTTLQTSEPFLMYCPQHAVRLPSSRNSQSRPASPAARQWWSLGACPAHTASQSPRLHATSEVLRHRSEFLGLAETHPQ